MLSKHAPSAERTFIPKEAEKERSEKIPIYRWREGHTIYENHNTPSILMTAPQSPLPCSHPTLATGCVLIRAAHSLPPVPVSTWQVPRVCRNSGQSATSCWKPSRPTHLPIFYFPHLFSTTVFTKPSYNYPSTCPGPSLALVPI